MVAVLRDQPYAAAKRRSVEQRMAQEAREPRTLEEYVAWYRSAWLEETPGRLHQRGVEPQSALGTPVLGGAFRAYLCGSPWQTDHDDRIDIDRREECYVRPMHAALAAMARKWPLSAHYLFAIAWCGVEWQDVAFAWRMLPEIGHRFTYDALRHLWRMYERSTPAV